MPHLSTDYFNLSRPLSGNNNQKPDQLHSTGVDVSFSKLRLQAFPNPGLIPPSPFELEGSNNNKASEKLNSIGRLGRKGGKRRVVEFININGVDEPFITDVDDDEPQPLVEKNSDSATGLLPPPNGFLPLYE